MALSSNLQKGETNIVNKYESMVNLTHTLRISN